MFHRIRQRATFANVVSLLALFVALGGSSYAAVQLNRNSVLSRHITNGEVKRQDVGRNAVSSSKVEDGRLLARDFAAGQLPAGLKGDKGDPGRAGADGAPGATKVVVRKSANVASIGPNSTVDADCAPGERAVGGGVEDLGNTLFAFSSRPKPAVAGAIPTGWQVANNTPNTTFTVAFTVWVVCASP